jgi:hypothetical protein
MKWFLCIWTAVGLWAVYHYLTPDTKGDGFFGPEFYRLGMTVISIPFVMCLGALLFGCVTHVFEKLRKVHP